jgi:hypothetical protein
MKRSGLTLLEMAVGLASSVVLVAGLAGSLYISSQTLPTTTNPAQQSSLAASVVRDLIADVNLALSFTEQSPSAITFTVPDRNGDSVPETIRYAWSGTVGDPLTYQYNSGSLATIATDVQVFNLEALTRELLTESSSAPVAENVAFEEPFTENRTTSGTSLTVACPPGTVEGSLLIAAVALDGNAASSLAAAGWTQQIYKGPTGGSVVHSFGVWSKIASSAEPSSYQFTWTGSRHSYGWIMRFSGHDSANPIHVSASAAGSATNVPSPTVTTAMPNTMILRLGGFDGPKITTDSPGLPLHTVITMDRSSNLTTACSGGAGYKPQETAGSSGTSTFSLTGSAGYATVTIAIAPAQAE